MDRPRLLRVPEVAEALQVSRTTVYMILKSGELPSVRIGGCRRVVPDDLQAYVEARRLDIVSTIGTV